MKKFYVRKKVLVGDKFFEDHYTSHPETFIGCWSLCGNDFDPRNPSFKVIFCDACIERAHEKKRREVLLGKDRSYQVVNFTNSLIKYDWSGYQGCENVQCWGRKERYIKILRHWVNRKHFVGYQYSFSNFNVGVISDECTDRFYFNLEKTENPKLHEAITSQTTKSPKFFFPNIIDNSLRDSQFYLHIQQEDFSKSSPNYRHPSTLKIDHYRRNEEMVIFPTTASDLSYHKPAAASIVELYPGGAGLKVSQFKYVENETIKNSENLIYNPSDPVDLPPAAWVYSSPAKKSEVFVEGLQNGWVGPIVSYWSRYDHLNSFFPY